jgi:hypothetical protein
MSTIFECNTVASLSQGSIVREPTNLGWTMQRFIESSKKADTKQPEQEPKKDFSFFQYTVETNRFMRERNIVCDDDCVSCVSGN